MNDGTVSAPSIAFNNDADTGIYRIGDNNLGLAVNGTKAVDIDTTRTLFTSPLYVPDGKVTAPSITFVNDPDTGLYRYDTGIINYVSNGVSKVLISDIYLNSSIPFIGTMGSAAAPTFAWAADPSSGWYLNLASNPCLSVGSSKVIDVNAT